jgi:hypothetical protein
MRRLRVLELLIELPNQISTKLNHVFSAEKYVVGRSLGSYPPISVYWCRNNLQIAASGYLANQLLQPLAF